MDRSLPIFLPSREEVLRDRVSRGFFFITRFRPFRIEVQERRGKGALSRKERDSARPLSTGRRATKMRIRFPVLPLISDILARFQPTTLVASTYTRVTSYALLFLSFCFTDNYITSFPNNHHQTIFLLFPLLDIDRTFPPSRFIGRISTTYTRYSGWRLRLSLQCVSSFLFPLLPPPPLPFSALLKCKESRTVC